MLLGIFFKSIFLFFFSGLTYLFHLLFSKNISYFIKDDIILNFHLSGHVSISYCYPRPSLPFFFFDVKSSYDTMIIIVLLFAFYNMCKVSLERDPSLLDFSN